MSFEQFLREDTTNKTEFVKITDEQLSIIKREIDRNAIKDKFESEYIKNETYDLKLVDSTFYVSNIALNKDEEVLVKTLAIVEVTETDGYIFYKPIEFIFNIDTNEASDFESLDKNRNENWKTVQSEILKYSSTV